MVKGVVVNTKRKKPLVHLVQNYVTANDCANLCLSVGAHPIMADSACEVKEITSCADALVLNMGTLNEQRIESMLISGRTANQQGIPVILDPVGVGASRFRYESVLKLLKQIEFSIIRGNFSEIQMIAYAKSDAVGVDSGINVDDVELKTAAAKEVAMRYSCIVVVTGDTDIILDKEDMIICANGHKLMKQVTGTGCMMTSLMACYLAANENRLNSVMSAVCAMGISGEKAYMRMKEDDGMASYKRYLLDAIGNMNEQTILEDMKIENRKIRL